MLALELHKDDVKKFMGRLLREGLFDSYEARLAEIVTVVRVAIDGAAETEGYAKWETTRPLVYEIIKLTEKPKMLKLVFSYAAAPEIHKNAAALFLNIVYENDGVTFTTACAQKEFAMDKSLDIAWDDFVRAFFEKAGIVVTDRL
ncbi:MAG: DUF5721 family protein [Defluviitaleaceae bacterium]|nr:DUF5721 family protein [Defluviitaleaceae bacterium]